MRKTLNRRVKALESDYGRVFHRSFIFLKSEKSEAEAIAEWEAFNGPLDSRKPLGYRIGLNSPCS